MPVGQESDTRVVDYWDCDLLDDEGERRFKGVAKEIRKAAAVTMRQLEVLCPTTMYDIYRSSILRVDCTAHVLREPP